MVLMKFHVLAINFGVQDETDMKQWYRLGYAVSRNSKVEELLKKDIESDQEETTASMITKITKIDTTLSKILNFCKTEKRILLLTYLNDESLEYNECIRKVFKKFLKACREQGVTLRFLVDENIVIDSYVENLINEINRKLVEEYNNEIKAVMTC